MSILVRRSNLVVSMSDAAAVENAWRHDADAITLDLRNVPANPRNEVHSRIRDAISAAARGGAEVFVRVNDSTETVDLEACVWPGLTGIMLPRVESAADVAEAAEVITVLERERGLELGSIRFIALIESAAGVWHLRHIVTASPRITQAALDERALAQSLDIDPLDDYDPFVYARGRLAVESTAAKVAPVGMAYPLSAKPREAVDLMELFAQKTV